MNPPVWYILGPQMVVSDIMRDCASDTFFIFFQSCQARNHPHSSRNSCRIPLRSSGPVMVLWPSVVIGRKNGPMHSCISLRSSSATRRIWECEMPNRTIHKLALGNGAKNRVNVKWPRTGHLPPRTVRGPVPPVQSYLAKVHFLNSCFGGDRTE